MPVLDAAAIAAMGEAGAGPGGIDLEKIERILKQVDKMAKEYTGKGLFDGIIPKPEQGQGAHPDYQLPANRAGVKRGQPKRLEPRPDQPVPLDFEHEAFELVKVFLDRMTTEGHGAATLGSIFGQVGLLTVNQAKFMVDRKFGLFPADLEEVENGEEENDIEP